MTAGACLIAIGTVLVVVAFLRQWRAHRGTESLLGLPGWLRKKRSPRGRVYGLTSHGAELVQPVTAARDSMNNPDANAQALALRLDEMTRELGQLRAHVDYINGQSTSAHESLRRDLGATRTALKESATGDLRLELVGVILVGIGSVLTAVPGISG